MEKGNFTTVPNSVAFDPRLSMKALGLFCYVKAKPEGWRFSAFRMMQEKRDGRDSIRSAIRELESLGILRRTKELNEKGHYVGDVFFLSYPETGFPAQENPAPENPAPENPAHHKEREYQKREKKNGQKSVLQIAKEKSASRIAENRAKIARLDAETNIEKQKALETQESKKKCRSWIESNPILAEAMKKEAERISRNANPNLSAVALRAISHARFLDMVAKKVKETDNQ